MVSGLNHAPQIAGLTSPPADVAAAVNGNALGTHGGANAPVINVQSLSPMDVGRKGGEGGKLMRSNSKRKTVIVKSGSSSGLRRSSTHRKKAAPIDSPDREVIREQSLEES